MNCIETPLEVSNSFSNVLSLKKIKSLVIKNKLRVNSLLYFYDLHAGDLDRNLKMRQIVLKSEKLLFFFIKKLKLKTEQQLDKKNVSCKNYGLIY